MVARGYGIMVFIHTLKEVNLGCKGLWDYGIYTTFNNISVILYRSVLLVEETEVSGENKRPIASHRQTVSHNVVSSTFLTHK